MFWWEEYLMKVKNHTIPKYIFLISKNMKIQGSVLIIKILFIYCIIKTRQNSSIYIKTNVMDNNQAVVWKIQELVDYNNICTKIKQEYCSFQHNFHFIVFFINNNIFTLGNMDWNTCLPHSSAWFMEVDVCYLLTSFDASLWFKPTHIHVNLTYYLINRSFFYSKGRNISSITSFMVQFLNCHIWIHNQLLCCQELILPS